MTTALAPRYTQDGYTLVRQSWQDLIEMFGLTKYRAPRLAAAYQLWADNAPECADGDDWTVAAAEWQRTYLTVTEELPTFVCDPDRMQMGEPSAPAVTEDAP